MTEVASAYVSLIPSAKGFQSGIERQIGGDVVAASRSQGHKAGSVFARSYLGPLKLIGASALGFFAVDKLKDVLGFGLEVAAQNEQAQISFTTMLGSAKKARDFIGQLQQFAAKTPFDFPGLQRSASSLISIGVNAKDVIPIMTTLGNVTSGMGTGSEGIQRATVALQQMIAAQAIHAEDLNQLRDAGIPVYDLLSAALGKSKKEVSGLVQAGKLGKPALDALMGALQSGKGLERFNGLMDKQSQSLTGLVSTFKDTFGQGLAKAITPLIPLIKKGLGGASEFLAKALPKASDAVKGFIQGAENGTGAGGRFVTVLTAAWHVTTTLASAIGTVVGFLTKHKAVTIALTGAVVALVAITKVHAAVMAVEAAGGLLKYLKATRLVTSATKVWTAVQWAFNVAMDANPIGVVILAIAALVAGIIYAYKHSETFRNIVDTAFHAIGEAGKWLWNNALQPVIKFIVEGFALVADKIGDFLGALSHLPGFGWAKTAADAMHAAADKAQELADNINKIHDKTAVVTIDWQQRGIPPREQLLNAGLGVSPGVRMRASGGPVDAGSPYIVGEKGPELFVPGRSGSIIPHGALGAPAGDFGPRRVQLVVGDREFSAYVREQAGSQYVTERHYDHVTGVR